jgi:hypothetical protein
MIYISLKKFYISKMFYKKIYNSRQNINPRASNHSIYEYDMAQATRSIATRYHAVKLNTGGAWKLINRCLINFLRVDICQQVKEIIV